MATGNAGNAGNASNAGNAGNLMGMPDDTFAMVLAAIDQPQAAACMLATCQRVGVALRAPDAVAPSTGPDAPMIVQVQAVSTLRLRDVGEEPFHRPALELASACGWVQLFPLLVRPAARPFIYNFAATGGHLALLQWARAQGAPWDAYTCKWAAQGGHLELLQWARAQTPPAPWDEETCACAAGGHLELLQWARAQGAPWDALTCTEAAYGGHLALLQWARAQTLPAP